MLAGAAAGLNRELAFAFGAEGSVAFYCNALAEYREVLHCGDHLAAMRGLVAESDDASSVLILHSAPVLCGSCGAARRIAILVCRDDVIVGTEEDSAITPVTRHFQARRIEAGQRIMDIVIKECS